jgi:hypothetical protein
MLVSIQSETIQRALLRDEQAGKPFRRASIEGGKGRFYGYLGEEVVKQEIPQFIHCDVKDYDLKFDKYTFDVKTKTRKDAPKPWFDATVDESAHHQRPDYYIFVQILAPQGLIKLPIEEIKSYKYTTAWILGYLHRSEFYSLARYFRAGETDKSNNITYRDSIYLVKCNQLKSANVLKDKISKYIF